MTARSGYKGNTMNQSTGQIAIYQTDDGQTRIDVRMEHDSVWLRQEQMSELFGRERSVITKHLRNIFVEGELEADSVCANFAHTAEDGKTYQVRHYNLDVAISVGYRVKSIEGTRFRQWATQRLKDYLVQGYSLNQQRLEAQQEKLAELRQAIALSARLIHNKSLSTVESQGILAILEKYSHALTVLE
ncbi:MAG: filamentation induced by cAMP protein Fic [Gallionellaceae bacterium]|nr:MAG: filamentation induced by cAMP protein Fic [Gallionellaceae bacterium]